MKKNTHGAREWASKSINIVTGCEHDCLYCYARCIAERFKRVTPGEWENSRIRQHDVDKKHGKYQGQVMFPSAHDITPSNLGSCLIVLRKLLKAGNRVLIVSKPHLECIERICEDFLVYRNQILFRFTIGAMNDSILTFWEPGAPHYEERKACLVNAFENGFKTSVSVEPMLDSANIDNLVNSLLPFVTDSIWIGKMNRPGSAKRVSGIKQAVQAIKNGQTDPQIQRIYDRWQGTPKVKWKESIKKVVGVPLITKPGLDM